MSIVDTWFTLEASRGRSVGEALGRIAHSTGREWSHSYLGKIRRGDRPLDPAVYRFMVREVLAEDLELAGDELAEWVEAISPPQRTKD